MSNIEKTPIRPTLEDLKRRSFLFAKMEGIDGSRPNFSDTKKLKRRGEDLISTSETYGLNFIDVLNGTYKDIFADKELTPELIAENRNKAMDLATYYLGTKPRIEPEKREKFDKLCSMLGIEEPKKKEEVKQEPKNEPKLELNIYAPQDSPDPLYLRVQNPRRFTGQVINSKEQPIYKRIGTDRIASHALAFEMQKAQKEQ